MQQWVWIGVIGYIVVSILLILVTALFRCRSSVGLFRSAIQGVLALGAVHLLGGIFPVSLGIGWLSLGAAWIYGLPGVVCLLLLKVIFAI